jgi:hypothetical protein
LYSLVSHDNETKKIIPIGEFITTSQSILTVSTNLTILIRLIKQALKDDAKFIKVAPIIVVDHSWTLISSCMISFNQTDTLKYLTWAYEVFIEKN